MQEEEGGCAPPAPVKGCDANPFYLIKNILMPALFIPAGGGSYPYLPNPRETPPARRS